jgi:uncharacterized membrane protein YfcA
MDLWYLIPIGIFIATFASLIGIGGGLLWAPFLILVLKLDPKIAILISFIIQLVGMGSATFSNIRNKQIFWKLSIRLLPFIAVGVITGSFLSQRLADSRFLEMGMGIVGIFVSLFFAFQTEKYDANMNLDKTILPPLWFKAESGFFGIISGLFSVGIGDFLIPLMRTKLKIPMKYTIGTSLFLNFSIALMGSIFSYSLSTFTIQQHHLWILGYSWIGVIIGGQLGPKLSNTVADTRLKEIFIFALLLIGIHLIYQSLS